jgi:hypothetical protein
VASPSSSGRREEIQVKEGRRIAIQPAQEQVLANGVNAEDERFSMRSALVFMVILSVVAITARFLSLNPFSDSFNFAFVYLPTAVLIIASYKGKRKASGSGESLGK